MHTYIFYRRLTIITLSLIGLLYVEQADASRPYEEVEKVPHRFRFLRPAMDAPEDQLEHARALREDGKLRKARRQYRALVRYWPNRPQAPLAQQEKAEVQYERGKLNRAFDAYQELFENYQGLFPHAHVLEQQYNIALEIKGTRRGRFLIFRGFEAPERALPLLESIIDNGPRWHRAPEVQLSIGQLHKGARDYSLAVLAYDRVEARYPRSPYVEQAAFGKARSLYRLSEEAPNHVEGAETAMVALSLFIMDYPESEFAADAREYLTTVQHRRARLAFEKADYYDRLAKQPRAALTSYKMLVEQFPNSDWNDRALKRIRALEKKLEQ